MGPGTAAPELVGRQRELRVLVDLLERGAVGGAVLVVLGDPGVGKSALLRLVERRASDDGWRVLTVVGVESEAQLPFAGLHQLLRPVQASVRDLQPGWSSGVSLPDPRP